MNRKGDDLPLKKTNYKEINHDLLTYNRDYTTSTILPSYLKHELNK